MKKRFWFREVLWLVLFPVMSLLNGCCNYSGRFEVEQELLPPPDRPFKFRIETIDLSDFIDKTSTDQATEKLRIQNASRKSQEALLTKYPEYFTTSKSKSFPVSIKITYDPKKMVPRSEASSAFLGVASLFTVGIIPATMTVEHQWHVNITVGDLYSQKKIAVVEKNNISVGLIGSFFRTYKLLSDLPDYHYKYDFDDISDRLSIQLTSPQMLKIFVSALARLDHNKLQETYNASQTKHTILLE